MKKIVLSLALLSTMNAFAVEMSESTNQNTDISKSKSIKAEIRDGTTDTQKTGESSTVEVSVNTYPLFLTLSQKDCVKKPKTFADFGIKSTHKNGGVDVYAQQFLDNAGRNSLPISKVTKQQSELKKNTICLIDEGARIAQAVRNFSIKPLNNVTKSQMLDFAKKSYEEAKEIKDINIEFLALGAKDALARNECTFYQNADTIKCGQIIITGDGTVRFGSQPLWGMGNGVDQNYGISATLRVAMSTESSFTKDISNSMSGTIDRTKKVDTQQSSKQELSTRPVMPTPQ